MKVDAALWRVEAKIGTRQRIYNILTFTAELAMGAVLAVAKEEGTEVVILGVNKGMNLANILIDPAIIETIKQLDAQPEEDPFE